MTSPAPSGSVTSPALDRRRSPWWLIGVVVLGLTLAAFAWGEVLNDTSTASGFVVVPVLLVLAAPLLRLEARRNQVFDGAGIIFTALAVRCLGAFARLYVSEEVYSGQADSSRYDFFGLQFAESFIKLDFDIDPGKPIPGTGFLRVLTGVVYVFVGSDKFAGFLVFSFLSFIGTYLLYRAFVIAMPDGDHRRFSLLVFFWPALVFWPSSIGKEAWMLLGIGVASWGVARLLSHARFGYTTLAIGVLGVYALRPHVAILFVGATAVAAVMALLFRSGDSVRSLGFLTKAMAVVVITVLGALLAPRVASFVGVEDLGPGGITEALEEQEERTSEGGSSFESVAVDSVVDYPWALVTVLFRPFPNEVDNAQSAISAGEGLLLLVLLAASFRAIRRLPVTFVKRPYIAFAASYVLMFGFVFASIGNFGILARQRTQVLPMLFVFVALPLSDRTRRDRRRPLAPAGHPVSEPPGPRPRLNVVTTGIGPPRHS